MRLALLIASISLKLLSSPSFAQADQCFQVIYPEPNHFLETEEHTVLDVTLRINCPEDGPARRLRIFSATGNGTAGGLLWETGLDGSEEMFSLAWNLGTDYTHWHCSGWRQWKWMLERGDNSDNALVSQESVLIRVRANLLEDALERVQVAAASEERRPTVVQIGAMDGQSHDHLYPFLIRGGWSGVLVEPLSDYFEALQTSYRGVTGLSFANVAIAEEEGTCTMHRVDPSALSPEAQGRLGLDGSSSLLVDAAGLPPGIATTMPPDAQAAVAGRILQEKVRCIRLGQLLEQYGLQDKVDVLAIDAEGYDLRILSQLNGTNLRPGLVFMEVGLLPPAEQAAAEGLLRSWGYEARPCGYGMELVAARTSSPAAWPTA